MKVFFLRHGVTQLNIEGKLNGQIDEPLMPQGFKQASEASLLVPSSIKHIYASSMLRTIQTADIVSRAINVPVSAHDELREVNMGTIAGRSWGEPGLGEEFKNLHRSMRFDYRDIGGESATEFRRRVLGLAEEINDTFDDHKALIVAHGGVQRLFHLLEKGEENQGEIENALLLEFDLDQILSADQNS